MGDQSTIDVGSIDLTDLDNFESGPPWELFRALRREAPVHWNELPGDEPGFWSLTRFEDIAAVHQDSATYSSGTAGVFIRNEQVLPWEIAQTVLLNQDPPDHTRTRGIVQKVFNAGAVAAREQSIRDAVDELIDEVIEAGECDLVSAVSTLLPLRAIAKFGEIGGYLFNLVADRRENPVDDLISRLANAEVDGEKLDDIALTGFVAFLLSAGSEEVRNAYSGGVRALIEHPDQMQALKDDPSLIPTAIEEIMRWHSPIFYMRRTTTADVEIRGTKIEAGSKVVVWYPSGNRDEDAFEDPDVFEIRREPNKHQAFGGGGRHFCLGNQLARLELKILFEKTLERMPDIAISGDVEIQRSNFFHGIDRLPVSFTPGERSR